MAVELHVRYYLLGILNIFKTVAIVSFMTLWYIINKGHVIMKGIGKR